MELLEIGFYIFAVVCIFGCAFFSWLCARSLRDYHEVYDAHRSIMKDQKETIDSIFKHWKETLDTNERLVKSTEELIDISQKVNDHNGELVQRIKDIYTEKENKA